MNITLLFIIVAAILIFVILQKIIWVLFFSSFNVSSTLILRFNIFFMEKGIARKSVKHGGKLAI